MHPLFALTWPQLPNPLNSMGYSAVAATIPLVTILVLMGWFRKSGWFASACGLLTTVVLALVVWKMPFGLMARSVGFGFLYAAWPAMGIVFAGLWLYNLSSSTGKFELLRRWMAEHASGDACIQALLVAFCFGALLESCAGFGTPVAVTSFLLVGLGFEPRRAVIVALIANTAPVGFGGMGIPIVALEDVTALDRYKLSAMVGRQLPLLSVIVPMYLVWVVERGPGLKRVWPAALVTGASYAFAQFLVSNLWGPYATDIIAASVSTASLIGFLRVWSPRRAEPAARAHEAQHPVLAADSVPTPLSARKAFAAWVPWLVLCAVMMIWTYLKLFQIGKISLPVPGPHNEILITLYKGQPAPPYNFRPLDVGTAVLVATVLTALCFRVRLSDFFGSGLKTLRQIRLPGLTVLLIIGLAYLYNYSGMAYTLGAALAGIGSAFPLVSSYLGWVACFLSGSDMAGNLLFGKLQVIAADQLNLNPVLLAATNSSGGVISKMISPQNIAVGVTTVGLVGQEGNILRRTFWPSIVLAALLGVLAYAQAYWLTWMVPLP
jgi:L-lactate transport